MKLRSLKALAVVLPAGLGLLFSSATAAKPADTVLKNGTVLTMDKRGSVKKAVAVRDGRIAYTGSNRGARELIGKRTRVINLKGKTVMPGLIDAHSHPLAGGDILDDCDMGNIEAEVSDMIALIAECDKADPATGKSDWLQVSNWSPAGVLPAGATVTRQDLDAALPNRPVYVQGSDFHNSWVNSRALELAGVTKDTPDPPDGQFVREPDGTPTGLLIDGAQWAVSDAIPEKKFREVVADGRRAVEAMNASGITTVMDAAADPSTLKVWQALDKRHEMTLRMSSMALIDNSLSTKQAVAYYRKLVKRFATARLRIPGIKLLLDGVIEYPAQTAALLDPYLVEQDGEMVPGPSKGDLYFTQREVNALVTRFDRMRKLVHMHAVGDAATREGLNGAAAARRANHSKRRRNLSIAHLQLVDPADYGRFGKLGVFANMQLQWAASDYWVEGALRPYIGEERYGRLYPARSLIEAGAPLAMGSDWPVDPLNPWAEITTANTRNAWWGDELNPSESIPVARALKAHTMGSATQLGLANRIGSIKAGKDADVIVINRNPLKTNPDRIYRTGVLRTMVGGKTVYRRGKRPTALLAAASSRSTGEAGH